MAISINDVKQLVEDLAKKDQKTDYIKAAVFNRYAKAAQLDIINQQRNTFEMGSISSDATSELKKRTTVNVDPTTGQLSQPSDYLYVSALYKNVFNTNSRGDVFPTTNPVELVTDNELGNRLSSRVSPPTTQRPISVEYDGYFQIYPKEVGLMELVYIKEPLDPWWNYTVSSNVQVYAATGGSTTNPNSGVTAGDSTDFELPLQLRNELVYKICEYLGISVRQADLTQGAQFLKANQ